MPFPPTGKKGLGSLTLLLLVSVASTAYMAHLWKLETVRTSKEIVRIIEKPVEVIKEVPVEKVRDVVKEVVKEVPVEKIVSVPAELTPEQQGLIDFARMYMGAPVIKKGDDSLAAVPSVRVLISLDETCRSVIQEERIKDKFELTLRRNNVLLSPDADAILFLSLSGLKSDGGEIFVHSSNVELVRNVTMFAGPRMVVAPTGVWTSGFFGFAGKQKRSEALLNSAADAADRFSNAFLGAQKEIGEH